MPRKGKKQKARLAARIVGWEKSGSTGDDKNRKSNPSGFYMRKPGSLTR